MMQISGNGTIEGLQVGGLPNATVTQAEIAPNVSATGPAFRVYAASAVTALSSTDTKINFDTKTDGVNSSFDTTSAFDLSTDRFQPQVAGYYYISGLITVVSSDKQVIASIRRNGTLLTVGPQIPTAARTGVSDLIYLNGTTDYVELFGFSSPAQNTAAGPASTYFSGYLARAA
ncbi:hypothetical protein UFOVP580_14 [uncultured Caudovirales phage]|uniref:C1q domain-containing protein n=1 Tax=uncultured Caudovirales phage TaxID=2100421 RepID=A0A6J5PBV6_9CAUD|nr:hypothetical protein UFOVP580_14 [uncultured Caudovirales phage]